MVDFRSFISNDLKIISSSDNISDKQVLILTRKFDPEAERVAIKLLAKGIDSVRLNAEDAAKQMRVKYHIDKNHDPLIDFSIGDRNLDSSIFPVVWLRDFDRSLIVSHLGHQYKKFVQRYCYEQWNDSLQILMDSLSSEWINKPQANINASNRILQLNTAREAGLQIPSTLITNDPKTADEFYHDNEEQIIMKALHHHNVEIDDKVYSMYTRSVTKNDLSKLDDLVYAPCILQKRIHKKSELRVTVVDDKVFATELDVNASPNCRDDMHRCEISEIPKKTINLDITTKQACLKMMNTFDLKYCTFDFILDEKNELYFLEINPSGDWYWIEHDTKAPITNAMVGLLESLVDDSAQGEY